MATISGLKIATTGSGHFCPGPSPAVSFVPPTPPAGPVTAPFVYISHSSSAAKVATKFLIDDRPVLVRGSVMSIHKPGNLPGQPTGGDIVTHVTAAYSEVFCTGQMSVLAGGNPMVCTNDMVRMNVPYSGSFIAQSIGRLITMDNVLWARSVSALAAGDQAILDPISVVSGAVVDADDDISLPGAIPLVFTRRYDSSRSDEHGPLGRGGFSHVYDQWIEIGEGEAELRDEDGSTVAFRNVIAGQPIFHRGKRLELRVDARGGGASVRSTTTHLRRVYRVLPGSRRAMLVEIENEAGQTLQFQYEEGRLARIIDTAGRVLRATHDEEGHITRISVFGAGDERTPLLSVSYAYDVDGMLVRAVDPLGHATTYAYDDRRRLVQKTLPTGLSFYYVYDPETGRCVRSFGDGGLHAGDIAYDEAQGITRLTGTPEPRVFKWRPKDGAMLEIGATDPSTTKKRAADDDGNLLEEGDAAGNVERYAYDERGHLVSITDPLGRVTKLAYGDDRLIRRTAAGGVTSYGYDARGNLESLRYPDGTRVDLAYDERGRLARIFDAAGIYARFVWDEQHNCVEEHLPGGAVRKWQYDGLGRAVACTDAYGNTTRRELDAMGRVLVHENPDGTRVRFEYDALGRMLSRTDELGRVTTWRHVGTRSVALRTQEDGGVWRVDHDVVERPQRVHNPKGEVFDFRYDRLGRVREMRTFDGRIFRATWGRDGKVSRFSLPDGTWRAYRYDAAGELVEEDTPHGKGTFIRDEETRTETFALEDPAGVVSVEITREKTGQIAAVKQPAGTLRYEYDSMGRVVASRLPSGRTTRLHYDATGNVSALEHGDERVDFQRDEAGTLIAYRFARSGIEARFSFDARTRITQQWAGKDGRGLVSRHYAWDAASTLTGVRDARWGDIAYRHDALGQLVEARSQAGHERFSYDAAGSVEPEGGGWEIRPGNVLSRSRRAEYEYDEGGRRIREKRLDTGEVTEYFWDCRGNLREVLRPDGTQIVMTYDLFGRRVKKEVFGALRPISREELPPMPSRRTVEYLWDGPELVAEIDAERGERTLAYHPGTLAPLLQGEGDEILGVFTDAIGASTELFDREGALCFSGLYGAWGGLSRQTGAQDGKGRGRSPIFRRLGHHHDEDVGLSYVRHRWFDPEVMRFLSPDPLHLEGGTNLFGFNGSPVMHVDPLGLACIIIGNPKIDNYIHYCMYYGARDSSVYQAYVHGTVSTVEVKNPPGMATPWTTMSPTGLGQRMMMAGNWNRSLPVQLMSCNTGRRPDGFAPTFAKNYKVNVIAPNELVWGDGRIAPAIGVHDSSTYRPKEGEPVIIDPSRPGQWNYFTPDGKGHGGNAYDPHLKYNKMTTTMPMK